MRHDLRVRSNSVEVAVRWLRGIRAAMGIGITWAFLWTIVGVALALVLSLVVSPAGTPPPSLSSLGAAIGWFALDFGIIGAINGVLFSIILATLGRQLRDRLRLHVIGGFGALAGAALPVVFSIVLRWQWKIGASDMGLLSLVVAAGALVGALSALATFAIAQPPTAAPESAVS